MAFLGPKEVFVLSQHTLVRCQIGTEQLNKNKSPGRHIRVI